MAWPEWLGWLWPYAALLHVLTRVLEPRAENLKSGHEPELGSPICRRYAGPSRRHATDQRHIFFCLNERKNGRGLLRPTAGPTGL